MPQKLPFYTRFLFVWLILTVIYVTLTWRFHQPIPSGFSKLIGVFVPFGVWNTLASLSWKGFITAPLLLLSLRYADSIAARWGIATTGKKLLFDLAWLFLLTLVVDLVLWLRPMSLILVLRLIS